ncbi:MAG: Clp protease N-terminal domain-containing protein, partial [Nitrospirota bacterium]
MINKELEITIEATVRDAEARRHEYLTVEHILFAILHDEWGIDIITHCGGDVERIKSSLEDFFRDKITKLPDDAKSYPAPTIAFRRVF